MIDILDFITPTLFNLDDGPAGADINEYYYQTFILPRRE